MTTQTQNGRTTKASRRTAKKKWTEDDCMAEAMAHFQECVRNGDDHRVEIGADRQGRKWYFTNESCMYFTIEREDGKGAKDSAEAITPRDIAGQIESIAYWMAELQNHGGS